ncbi:efflux RND transporter periplasmic adaptor subunit [Roseiconus nitratireducens]|uniref:Efflux RND transporter periplasmic adaptor subunit n=1 Tax=Roseiconus nitratireducens TaxID=2605748 RepID=A0A5M6D4X6_9BACT|nr:efflux RND transporter periplasmic adaptor subunit [Roseiconus nitratireducens]KAA5542541.1 efflux RND transporter periplasmic adaptor subunit [Roseiconus nitratireducens]
MKMRPTVPLFQRCQTAAVLSIAILTATLFDPSPVVGQDDAAPVTAKPVRYASAGASSQFLGTVIPIRKTTIGCAVAGRVDSLLARRGQRVSQGDRIAELQSKVVRVELNAAKAEFRLAEQQLAELEAGSRAEDIAEAKAKMQAAAAIARRASNQLNRARQLLNSNAASQEEIDVATAEAESSEQLFQAAEIAYQRLVAGPRVEQVAQAQARLDLQREQVRLLRDRLSKHTLRAPFDGYITAEHTQDGAWLSSGDPVVELIELDRVQVEVAVPAEQVAALVVGQEVRIKCSQHPAELLIGVLNQVVPAADTRARTFPVLLQVDRNPIRDGIPILLSGMIVRAYLPVGPEAPALFVPTDALVLDQTRQTVFVIDTAAGSNAAAGDGQPQGTVAGTVREVPVTIGVANEGWIAVTGDLREGDLVVTRGNEGLTPGQNVEASVSDG